MPHRARAAALLVQRTQAKHAYDTAASLSERIVLREELRHLDALYGSVLDAARASNSPQPPALSPSDQEPADPV